MDVVETSRNFPFVRTVSGDTIFFDWGGNGTIDHVGIVESVSGGTVNTIEGNRKSVIV